MQVGKQNFVQYLAFNIGLQSPSSTLRLSKVEGELCTNNVLPGVLSCIRSALKTHCPSLLPG